MNKFKIKSRIIEALQFTGDNFWECYKWLDGSCRGGGETLINKYGQTEYGSVFIINHVDGDSTALPSDWIIKDIDNNFYRCKSDMFKKKYEKVEN